MYIYFITFTELLCYFSLPDAYRSESIYAQFCMVPASSIFCVETSTADVSRESDCGRRPVTPPIATPASHHIVHMCCVIIWLPLWRLKNTASLIYGLKRL